MLKKIKDYVNKWNMLETGDRVIAGVSGGADSVCLLFVLMQLQKEIPFELIVVHVNHGLRGEDADADESYVRSLCDKYRIPFVSYLENIELTAKKRKQSLEEAGREVRREAFQRTLKKYNGTKIALAHHKNDNAETFLMNVVRGSGLKGLGGMRPVTGAVIRPLLVAEREEIEEYLRKNQILFCTDETNKSDDYTRNRIRNHVLPYLTEQINDKAVSHINDTMERLQEIWEYMEDEIEKFWSLCVVSEQKGYLVLREQFEKIPNAVKPLLLKRVVKELTGREKDIEALHLEMFRQMFEKQVGKRIDLPYETEARRVYKGVEYRKKTADSEVYKAESEFVFEEDGLHDMMWGGLTVRYRVFEADACTEECSEKTYTKWFDYDIINGTIGIRTRKSGDYITVYEDGKTQKLKSFFINQKIPQEKRGEIPLIAEGSHILWVVGYRVNNAYRISKNTKRILEIQIEEGENDGRDN